MKRKRFLTEQIIRILKEAQLGITVKDLCLKYGLSEQCSLTLHTIFHKNRKPLRDCFWAIFLVATRTTGSSAHQLQYDLGISCPTAWSSCHNIRKAMEDGDTRYNLRGMVELDDTYIGGKKKPGKRGRGAKNRFPVLVAVESRPKGCSHVALRKVTSVISSQAWGFVGHSVAGDSLIVSDGLSFYQSLAQDLNLHPMTVGNGQRGVKMFPDVDRVIARLKT